MAITTVNPRYEGFIFDGENSRNYGIYVQDVKVFGAPTRDVEMISIPGRDGEFALDKGRFNNIQVVYTCALGTGTQADFNTGVSDFRNWLASRKGYKRLEDEINNTEYRMAVFKDGLDVSTLNKETGTFEVTFDCKPQRFLKSGETEQTVTSGGTLTNPTLFESRPLLQVDGYGEIVIGGELLSVYNLPLGDVALTYSTANNLSSTASFKYAIESTNLMNIGDPFYLSTRRFSDLTSYQLPTDCDNLDVIENPQSSDNFEVLSWTWSATISTTHYLAPAIGYILKNLNFIYGTPNTILLSWVFKFKGYKNGSNYFTSQVKSDISVEYNGAEEVTITISDSCVTPVTLDASRLLANANTNESVYAVSSVSTNDTTYIDLDIGEAYIKDNDSYISANNYVEIPTQLPVLEPGANTITFDNTVTKLEIVPRWWEV